MKQPAPRRSSISRFPSSPLLVAIVGGSGSGKTWLAEKLRAALGSRAARLSLDDFYRDRSHLPLRRRGKINFDHPRAIDWTAVEKALNDLRAGRAARLPRYDFKTHSRLNPPDAFRPKRIVLMEGLWLLRRPSLRRMFAMKIFIDCPTRVRLRRRLARDLLSRGRTDRSVRKQFWATVQPMHARFVEPQRRWADSALRHNFGEREARRLAEQLSGLLDARN